MYYGGPKSTTCRISDLDQLWISKEFDRAVRRLVVGHEGRTVSLSDICDPPRHSLRDMEGYRWTRPAVAGRRRGLPGPERCEPGPTGAFVCVDVQRRRRRWSSGVSLFWAASLFSIISAPRRACAIRVPLRPAASEGEGTGPVEVMPTTLVDWTRLYRDCGLRRTEEYPRVVPNRIGTNPERKLLRIV